MVQDGAGPAAEPPRPMTRREARALREARPPAADAAAEGADGSAPTTVASAAEAPTRTRPAPKTSPEANPKTEPKTKPKAKPSRRRRPVGYGVLLGCSLLLLGWALTALTGSALPGVHAVAGLSPLVSVLALPVLAVSAGRRTRVPALLAVLAAVLPWGFAASYAVAGPGPTEAAGRRSVRVMFVDADAGAADPASVIAAAQGRAADVVVITGLTDRLSHRLAVAGLNRLIPPRWVWTARDHHSGIGVYARQGSAAMHLVPGTPQPAAQGLLTTPTATFDLVVAQLPGSVLHARPGAGDGLRRLGTLPVLSRNRLLVGDLDAGPWNAGFRGLTRSGWHDAADVVGRGLRPTWPAASPLPITPVDHVLLGRGLGVGSADTTRVRGTDHLAVVVQVLLPRTRGQRRSAAEATAQACELCSRCVVCSS